MPDDTPVTHGWVIGVDPHSNGPPEAIIEGAVLRALLRTEHWLGTRKPENKFGEITMRAGAKQTTENLLSRFSGGRMNYVSALASEVASALHRLEEKLRCPSHLRELSEDFFESTQEENAPSTLIRNTAMRLYQESIPSMMAVY